VDDAMPYMIIFLFALIIGLMVSCAL